MKTYAGKIHHAYPLVPNSYRQGAGYFLALQMKKGGMGPSRSDGNWSNTVQNIMKEFAESGHPVFRCSSPLFRGSLKSRGHNASPKTAEPLLKTIIAVNISSVITKQ